MPDDKKLEVLLELLELQPEAYRERYNSNINLINNDKFLSSLFDSVNEPIKFDFEKNEGKEMKNLMKESSDKCSALSQQKAVKVLSAEMEKELGKDNITVEH